MQVQSVRKAAALRFAPVTVGNQSLGILQAEGIDSPILLADACAAQCCCGIAPLRMITVAEFERAAQGAQRVAVSLLAPSPSITAVSVESRTPRKGSERKDLSNNPGRVSAMSDVGQVSQGIAGAK